MPVTDSQVATRYPGGAMIADDDVAALRAILLHDHGDAGEILGRPGRPGAGRSFHALMLSAFTRAVELRFGGKATPATRGQVAEYVAFARERARMAKVSTDLDWAAAERLITWGLARDEPETGEIPWKDRFAVYVAFTMFIVHDEGLDDIAIEGLMLASRERADQWLAPDAMTVRFSSS
jgi:hypothetical protein